MNKLMINDFTEFDITGGIPFFEFVEKYQEVTSKVKREYELVSNFKIECTSGYYNDGEAFYQTILVSFSRLETDDEFETRKNQQKWIKGKAINSLKKLIDDNKDEAVKYIKELGLI